MFTEEGPELPRPSWEPVESAGLFAISAPCRKTFHRNVSTKMVKIFLILKHGIASCRDVSVRRLKLMPLHKKGKNATEQAHGKTPGKPRL